MSLLRLLGNEDGEEQSFVLQFAGRRKGPFSCFFNLWEMGFVPSCILWCQRLASTTLHQASSRAQCVLAPGMGQPSIFISSHYLQCGRSSLGELEQASPLHTFKPGPHQPVHFATRICQTDRHKKPPGQSEVITVPFDKKLVLILNPTVQFL